MAGRRLTLLPSVPAGPALLVWFVALALVTTWPMAADPLRTVIGHANADGLKHLWTLDWIRSSLLEEHRMPFSTRWVNWPTGMDLYPIEPLNGIIGALLGPLPVVPLANLLVLLHLVGTGLAGAWFGQQVSGTREGAFVAGTVLQGSTLLAYFVHLGVGELLALWWLPLGLGLLVRARRGLRWSAFVSLGFALAGAVWTCFYLGLFLAVATSVWSLLTLDAGRDTGRLLGRYALAAGLSLALVWPATQRFSESYALGSVPDVSLWEWIAGTHNQPVSDPPSARLDLIHLLQPGRVLSDRERTAYAGGRYLGWIALALGGLGLWRRRREGLPWLAVAAVGVVFAMGSELGAPGPTATVLPFKYVNRLLSYRAEAVNFPVRFLALTGVGLAALGALGARGRWAWLAVLAVAESLWLADLPYPRATFRPADMSALAVVADHEGHAIADLTMAWRGDAENRWSALSAQLVHRHPTQAVPIERVEYFSRAGTRYLISLQLVRDLEQLYNRKPGPLPRPDSVYRKDLALLADGGFGELMVNYRGGRERMPDDLVAALNQLCGPPLVLHGPTGLWAVPKVSATEAELVAWREVHAAAIEALNESKDMMGPSE